MPGKVDDLLPSAKEVQKRAATAEARNADEYVRLLTEVEQEKTALIESLGKTSDVSKEERIKLASAIIRRAARSGLSEVQVHRFSSLLCTDRGTAIRKNAAGWENTLAGVPLEIYRLWSNYLESRGYQIRYVMTGLPRSLLQDVSIVVSWDD